MRLLLLTDDGSLPDELVELVAQRAAEGDVEARIVLPVKPVPDAWTWDEEATTAAMLERLDHAIERVRQTGAEVEGTVGCDRDPMVCLNWVLEREGFDEVLLAGPDWGRARWLRMDLANRIRRAFDVPVTHVEQHPAVSAA
jgi:hypothetical protein